MLHPDRAPAWIRTVLAGPVDWAQHLDPVAVWVVYYQDGRMYARRLFTRHVVAGGFQAG